MNRRPLTLTLALLLAATLLPACGKTRKNYPDVLPGWHSASFDVVFGRLQRINAKDPAEPPVWVIHYGLANTADPYRGRFALMPAEKLIGYSGGEMVEIRGNIDHSFQSPNYTGTFYSVQSIRIWNGQMDRQTIPSKK